MLETDLEFEGVGAHRLNPRYDFTEEEWVVNEEVLREERTIIPLKLFEVRQAVSLSLSVAQDTTGYVRRLDGIDGSHHQPDAGPVDYGVVRRIPTDWLAWKVSQATTYGDPTWALTERMAEELGFRHFLGYHWLTPNVDAGLQAENYLRRYGKRRPGKGAMNDIEEGGVTVPKAIEFNEYVESELKQPTSNYSGIYVDGGRIWRSEELRESKYGPRPMHLAAYISRESLISRLVNLNIIHLPIHAWQYSSNGPVAGITGRCDMNTIINPAMFDIATSLHTTGGEMPDVYYTNSEPRFWNGREWPALNVKYRLQEEGTARRVSGEELADRGFPNVGLTFGIPKTNAELDVIGEWAPAGEIHWPKDLVLPLGGTISLSGGLTGIVGA